MHTLKPVLLLGMFILVSGRVLLPHEIANQDVRSQLFSPSNKAGGSSYNWGYFISPTRGHVEAKNDEGIVTGIVSFRNPHGNVVQWKYTADPQVGFKVTEYKESPPNKDGSVNPLLKSVDRPLGYIKPVSYEHHKNQVRYSIDDTIVKAAGSESQLAANLDAVPVAAVHDARAPPHRTNIIKEQVSPVLVSKDANQEFANSEYFLVLPTI